MSPWAELQSAFAAAIMDPVKSVPADCDDRGRFAVYRNNVMASLIEALQDRFPVTNRLVGDEFFRMMARAYAMGTPPRSPLLLEYGDTLPDFIAQFEPAASVPYLADVARLEAAWTEAYHAAEAVAIDGSVLNALHTAQLGSSSLGLHPSLRIVRSSYPIATLWEAHQHEEVGPVFDWRAEDVIILRPTISISLQLLPAGAYEFLAALMEEDCIFSAGEAALAIAPRFDLGRCLVELFEMGAIIALKPATNPGYPFHQSGPLS